MNHERPQLWLDEIEQLDLDATVFEGVLDLLRATQAALAQPRVGTTRHRLSPLGA